MPTLEALTDSVYRDLADEAKAVFSTLQVEDFVRGGIAELNRVSPNDGVESITWVIDPDTEKITQYEYDILSTLIYRVERRESTYGNAYPIPEAEMGQTVTSGYVFRQTTNGGHIEFPSWWIDQLDPATDTIRIYGYQVRPLPYTVEGQESPNIGISSEEEYSIRSYAKSEGFDLLAHDRSLFQQWQGQTNNTDVSPTQMMQMAANAKQDWSRHRGLIRTVRRYW
jgi:hypothetical protein